MNEAVERGSSSKRVEDRAYIGQDCAQFLLVEQLEHPGTEGVKLRSQGPDIDREGVGPEGIDHMRRQRFGELERYKAASGGQIGTTLASERQREWTVVSIAFFR